MAEELREYLGDDAIADARRVPGWKGNILVHKDGVSGGSAAGLRREIDLPRCGMGFPGNHVGLHVPELSLQSWATHATG